MSRPAGTTFSHLTGRLTVLRVECPKCGRFGRYAVRLLIDQQGRDVRILDWLDELTACCPPKRSASISD